MNCFENVRIWKSYIPNVFLGVFITDNNNVEGASEGVLDDGLEQFWHLVKDLEWPAAVNIFLKGRYHQNVNKLITKCF